MLGMTNLHGVQCGVRSREKTAVLGLPFTVPFAPGAVRALLAQQVAP